MTATVPATSTPRLRVFVVSNLFPSPVEPDRATYNRQQFAALARFVRLRVAVPVSWYRWRPGRYRDCEFDGVPATYFPFVYPPRVLERLHGLAMGLSLVATQLRRARQFAPHVILASWLHPDGYGAARLARALDVPLVVKVHGSDANVLAASPARRAQVQYVLARADAVVTVSSALRAKMLELGACPESTSVVYNGVDRSLFRPGDRRAARLQVGLEARGRCILYVGNLKVSKGCEDLLQAIATAGAAISRDVRIVFAGSGPDRERIVGLARTLGLGERVQFVGTVPHDWLPDWYRAADLVCLPSHNEGVPNVLLEAMACGVPVVATRVGGIPEVVPEHAGQLVESGHIAALSDALTHALHRSWPTLLIAQHAERFDWTTSAQGLQAVLERAAHEGHTIANDPRSAAGNTSGVTHPGATSG